MYNLNYFEKGICLCLDKRYKTQWLDLKKQFTSRNFQVEDFITGGGTDLPYATYSRIDDPWPKSNKVKHRENFNAMYKRCQDSGYKNALFLEDDVILLDNFNEVFNKAISDIETLNIKWDLLYLGVNLSWAKSEEVTPNLLRLRENALTTHAFAINNEHHDMFTRLRQLGPGETDLKIADVIQTNPEFGCYSIWPNIAIQKTGFSHIVGGNLDYDEYFKNRGTCL
jgi:hypothetical protein